MIQPFLLKDGKKTIYKGTRSECISKLVAKEGDLKVVENPKFKWIKRG